jgi:hypothetical protein
MSYELRVYWILEFSGVDFFEKRLESSVKIYEVIRDNNKE